MAFHPIDSLSINKSTFSRGFMVLCLFLCSLATFAQSPIELGEVQWLRDYSQALNKAQQEQKPVFILFQEVPGCATCRNYGQNVLSHPLLVEAIESLFVPLAIFNNKGGKDAEVLRMFQEPAWNNPVVRIIGSDLRPLGGRLSGNYTQAGLLAHMIDALNAYQQPVPEYLSLLSQEAQAREHGTQETYFAMYCFWSGEKALGQVEGVVKTEAGFMGGREVVKVTYDPFELPFPQLLDQAQEASCTSHVFANDATQQAEVRSQLGPAKVSSSKAYRPDPETKYYLRHSHYRYVPMTPLQAARVNSALGERKAADSFLSPRQQSLAHFIRQHPNKSWRVQIDSPFPEAWKGIHQANPQLRAGG